MPKNVPDHVHAIRTEIKSFFNIVGDNGEKIGASKYGVYAFYDFDGEPIYVGQTEEKISGRIGRHLTNQRTDAVAMSVLDPFEVAEIEAWPLSIDGLDTKDRKAHLARAEYTVFQKVLQSSALGAVLNEKDIPEDEEIELPKSYRRRIVPEPYFDQLRHPDVRIARRANTIANLAKVISEREVSKGLRRTLLTQARRLERLSNLRLEEITGNYPVEAHGEETGDEPEI